MNVKKNVNEERMYAREDLVYNVTEDLLVILEDLEISKKELARKLGKSRSYVTQILSGSRNMTLGSLSDICFALGFKPEIKLPVQEEPKHEKLVDRYFYEDWITADKAFKITKETIKQSTNVIDKSDHLHWAKAA
ncbi:transcriptional regulator [Aliiglaciecola sp. SL4]|uniref:helix-turn-helix transcriptional regulator n=1 Tax=Aliiglaciecola sp. SL4 TaxID=3239806 RepID=UPI00355B1A83